MCSRSNDSKWFSWESFISLFIRNNCQPKCSQRSPQTQPVNFVWSQGLTITRVTKCDLPYSMLCLNTADIQRGQESHKRKSLKERHPPCFSVMGGELSAEWEAHIWRPLPGCRIFWSRYTPDGWTTSKDKVHATKSIWGGCSEQCRCLCDFCQSNSVQFSSRTWSCSNFWAKHNWCNVHKWFFIYNLIVTKMASSWFGKNCMCKQNFWMIARVFSQLD